MTTSTIQRSNDRVAPSDPGSARASRVLAGALAGESSPGVPPIAFRAGGPGSGPRPGKGKPPARGKSAGGKAVAEKLARAKKGRFQVNAKIQRHAEDHNETVLAKDLGGERIGQSQPPDIVLRDASGKITHALEVKTMFHNEEERIRMDGEAVARKRTWSRQNNKAPFHTVVLDDTKAFSAGGEGIHDYSKRRIFYRRGLGGFSISKMYMCKDTKELKSVIEMPANKLPLGAK